MAFSAADLDAFIDFLQQDPQARDRVREAILADDFRALPGLVRKLTENADRMDAKLAEWAERDAHRFERIEAEIAAIRSEHGARLESIDAHLVQVDSQLDEHGKRFDRIDSRLDEHGNRLDRIDSRLDEHGKRLDRIDGRLGNLEGHDYERRFINNLSSRLVKSFRSVKRVGAEHRELLAALESGALTDDDWDDLHRADALAQGGAAAAPPGETLYLAVEVSVVVDGGDVARARRRAELLRKAGFAAAGVVAGQRILDEAAEAAQRFGVAVVLDREPGGAD